MIARPPKRRRRLNESAPVRSISVRDQSIVKQRGGITAIILAGSRPGADPLAQAYRSPIKALIPVAGKAMGSEEHTSELQSLMRISYAVFCLKKKNIVQNKTLLYLSTTIYYLNHT